MKWRFTARTAESDAVQRAQCGDVTGFEDLYQLHGRRVYAICLRTLKNTSDAEDVTQQVFLRIFREIRTFRDGSAFSTWLHQVTVNEVLLRLHRNLAERILARSAAKCK